MFSPSCVLRFLYVQSRVVSLALSLSNSYEGRLDFLLSFPPQPTTNILIFSRNRLDYFLLYHLYICLCGGRGMQHVCGIGGVYTGFWWANLREVDHLEDPGIDGRIILRWIFRKWDMETGTESIWLRRVTGGGHLWMRLWTFGFHKMRGISWLAEKWLASQEGLCSMK